MDYKENQGNVIPTPHEHEQGSQDIEKMPVAAEPVKNILAALGLVIPLPVSAEQSQEELAEALQAPERARRVAAVRALRQLRATQSLPLLQVALHHEDEAVRAAAVGVIGTCKEEAPVDFLLERLHDPAWYVRACAAHELGCQIERAPVVPLVEAMHDEDESVRAEAVWALGRLKEYAPEALLDALHDPSRLVREAVRQIMAQRIEQTINDTTLGEHTELEALLAAERAETEPPQEAYKLPGKVFTLPDSLPREQANKRLPETGPLAYLAEVAKSEQQSQWGQRSARKREQKGRQRTHRGERVKVPERKRRGYLLEKVLLAIFILGFGLLWYSLDQRFHQSSIAAQGSLSCVFHPGKNEDGNVMAWSPGKSTDVSGLFAVAGAGGSVVVYDADSCHYITTYKEGNARTILAMKWIVDGLRIAFLNKDGNIQIVQERENVASEQLLTIPAAMQANVVPLVAWSDDGQHLAVNWGNNLLAIWSIQEKLALAQYTAPYGQISALAWSPDSTEIAAATFDNGGNDGLIQIWNVMTRKIVAQDIYPSAKVATMAWSGDGENLLFYNQNNVIYKWNRMTQEASSTNTNYASLPQSNNFTLTLAWAPDNTRFIMSTDSDLQIWNATTNQSVMSIPNGFTRIDQLSWSVDSQHIAAASTDGTVQLWHVSG
ncbi:MAG TPA: HEAT repeat domain-containing protein [Ktedonobacteraceae bacterium]|jgi:WD40 repeat protein|nr:HEAT repeat domain-containing protein [Ktedonobacteraceae bacterium]